MTARTLARALLAAACLTAGAATAAAQGFPEKEIHAICMFPPGTGADILVRYFAAKLQETIGKPVVVENKVGAQGAIATEAVAKARPDGYTIAITPASSTMAMATHIFKKLNYDPVKDFEAVAPLTTLSFSFVVDAKSPINTIADLSAFLKGGKAKGFYGGAANTGIVSTELYLRSIGVTSQPVAFRTPADMMNALRAGDIDFVASDNTFAVGQVTEGRLRALAVTGSKRAGAMPNVPTMIESGHKDVNVEAWWAVYVPTGTPKPVIDKLREAFGKVMAMPDTKAFLARSALDPMAGDPESLKKLLISDIAKWGEYVKLAKIEPQ